MREEIVLFKSKLTRLADFKEMDISKEMANVEMDPMEIQKSLTKIVKKYVVMKDADSVQKGDFVTVDLKSDEKRYNKIDVPINIGSGLFDLEFETNVVDIKKGENRDIKINGFDVNVTVKSIKRRVVPEITDEMIMDLHIEGISTVNDYKNYIVEKASKEKNFEIITTKAIDYVIEQSEFIISEEDVSTLYPEEMKGKEAFCELQNTTLEELFAKPQGLSLEEFMEREKVNCVMYIKLMLIGMEYAKEDKTEYNEATYKEYIENFSKGKGISIDKAQSLFSYIRYMYIQYMSLVYDRIYTHYNYLIFGK